MASILTKDEYKTLRGITTADRDDQITAALGPVEDAISRYAERDFTVEPVTETRRYRYEGPIVNIDDAIEVQSVEIDDVLLDPDVSYTVEPYDRSQAYYFLDLSAYSGRRSSPLMGFTRNEDVLGTRQNRFVDVTAKWGWETVPEALKLAVALMVDEFASPRAEHSGISAEAVADTSVVYEAPEPGTAPPVLPPAVAQLVDPFRKIVL
jgi:hypothetical protein